jgi:hypothetical protein
MQAPVPGIMTKPAPYSLHNFTFELARGLAARGGREGASCALGSVSVCARLPSTIVMGSVTAAAIAAARQSVKRYLIAAHPITDIGDQVALALPPHQFRQRGDIRRNPSRLIFGEQLWLQRAAIEFIKLRNKCSQVPNPNLKLRWIRAGHFAQARSRMARNLREVIAAAQAERRAKVTAAYRQKLIAKKKKRQLEEAKRVMELDRNLIVIVVLIVTLPIIAALAAMLAFLAVGGH